MRSPDRFSLGGCRAIVTGASRGIGAAIATGLAEAGAEVFGLSRSGTAPDGVAPIACDLADDAALRRAIEAFAKRHDRLDVLVNAAAISLPANNAANELDRFRQTIATDLTGVYATILATYPLLKKAGNSSVINVTSINSVRGFPGNPGYVAAKAGPSGSTRWRPAISRPR
jgi:NAD(P)-dependent dehydrogenase (short-subunit alcohol dehydrogenase family)